MEAEDLLTVPSRTKGREATNGVIPGRFALSVGHPALPTPPGWKWTKLSDVARLESGHTPSRKHPEYWGGDVPWIGIKDAVDNHGRTINNTYQHVTELGLANSSARLLPKHTVCLSRTASIGYVTLMGRPMATSQDFVNWVCSDGIEPQFLKAILIAEHESLWRFASGTTHQTIYYPEVKAFHVCLPPIQEQRAIAHILGTLDDKIELNRQMNQTLEAMAWTIFNSWFKEDNFPDTWQLLPLEQCMAEIIDYRGKTPTKTSSGIPLITAKIVKDGRINEPQEYIAPQDYDSWMRRGFPERGDVVMTTEAPLGEIAQLDGRKIALAQRLITLRGKPGILDNTYLKFLMLSSFVQEQLHARATGTTVLGIRQSELRKVNLVIPPFSEQKKISHPLRMIEDKIGANEEQSCTLVSIRDTLLPKLLSGEIRVKEAKEIVKV